MLEYLQQPEFASSLELNLPTIPMMRGFIQNNSLVISSK